MGYCIEQTDSKFFIAKEDKKKALAAIKELANHPEKMGGGSWRGAERWFAWVTTHHFVNATTLEEALRAWRWEPINDKEGNVVDIHFEGEKSGDDQHLFSAIAPFVKKRSFIQMRGEDNTVWKWAFDGTDCQEVMGRILFDD